MSSKIFSAFFRLLCEKQVQAFLKRDTCRVLVDKYLLAGILIYFLRGQLKHKEYTVRNFFIALYICHEMYEEIDSLKIRIKHEYFQGKSLRNPKLLATFDADLFLFLERMNFNTAIEYEQCEILFNRLPHVVWYRTRDENHIGTIVNQDYLCNKCNLPQYSTFDIFENAALDELGTCLINCIESI